jgi:flagellar hook-associated protein 1 FlgK
LAEFRSQVLDPTINALGRLAVGLTESFNAQHRLGLDQQGNLGQDFFSSISPRVQLDDNNTGTGVVSGSITAVGDLTLSDYMLTFDGGNNYTLSRESDGTSVAIDTGGASPYATPAFDGFSLNITAGAVLGDQFRISPTALGARDIAVVLPSTDLIASALPVRGEENFANIGSGAITVNAVPSIANLPLTGVPVSGDIVFTFDDTTNTYTVVPDPFAEGPLAFDPATDVNGKTFSLLGGDVQITLSGQPRDGDQFTLTHNTGAQGDNANALALLDLESASLLESGTASLNQALAAQVSNIGSHARDAQRSESTFGAMLDQAHTAREEIAGVNLDEEAANLLRFQQSYQAAAEILRVTESLFQTLLGVIR